MSLYESDQNLCKRRETMKKLCVILLLIFAFLLPTIGQELDSMFSERVMPKDSLPNLWIVLFDETGSMTRKRIWQNMSDSNNDNGKYIPKKFSSLVAEYGDKGKDVFVLLEFGALIANLDSMNNSGIDYSDIDLVSSLIHESGTKGNDFNSVKKRIKGICDDISLFRYDMSYTSVVRPLSIYVVAKKMQLDFLRFRNVYSLLITDNGDNASDQWSSDYNTSRYRWKKHYDCFTRILPSIASSEFDFTSVKSGKFNEVRTLDVPPYYFLSQYVTYQDRHPETKLSADALVMVSAFHDDRLSIHMKPCGDSVKFVYVTTCKVNENPVEVNQYLYLGDTITVGFDKAFVNTVQNKVAAEGTYQEQYDDRVLGQRYRTVAFKGEIADGFVSVETKAARRQCQKTIVWSIVGTLLAFLVFILIWRNIVVLRIFVNGKRWSIKRKAMNRLKHGSFELLNVSYSLKSNNKTINNVFFYKGNGICISDDKKSKTILGQSKILLQAVKKLRISDVIEHPHKGFYFTYEYNDLPNEKDFSFSDFFGHNLFITSKKESWQIPDFETNHLQECNFQMLASYYEVNAERVTKVRNNVMVNLIRKESIGNDYTSDYAILNIYDFNYGNYASKIFLRYSLVCMVDLSQTENTSIMSVLLDVANYVLKKSEKVEVGFIDVTPNIEIPAHTSSIELKVSPLLSYLYIGNGRSRKVVYSPFKDMHFDQSALCDLRSKTVILYRGEENLTLSNSPMLNGGDYREVELQSYRRKTDTLAFLGDGTVLLLGEKVNYSYGYLLENTYGQKSYYAHNLMDIKQALMKLVK